MAKIIKDAKTHVSKKQSTGFNLDEVIPQKYQVLGTILFILVLFLIFLNPLYFGGKTFSSSDIAASESMQPYLAKARLGFTLWNPHIFCGMPAYSIAVGYTWFNLIYVLFTSVREVFTSVFAVEYARWSFYLIILAITSFFLMKHLTKNTLVSLFTAVSTSFSTGIIVFLYIGHVTKLTSLCMFPLIFLMLLRMQQKIKLTDIFILMIALQLLVQGFHVQIIFYLILATAVYYIYYFIYSLVTKQNALTLNLAKSAGILAFSVVVALAIQSDNFSQIYEYTPYSTRGTKGIKELSQGENAQSANDYYKYHTDWSFSPEEVATFVVPSFYGFGNSTFNDPRSGQEEEVNTYFGQMPFVDVAMYMGVIVFFLAIYGAVTRFKEPLVQFLTLLVVFSLLLSFGKNFSSLFNVFFYHLPYFDKFRVPSMILVLVQFGTPILAGLGLMELIKPSTKLGQSNNLIRNIAIGFGVILILSVVTQSALGDAFYKRALASKDDEQGIKYFTYLQEYMKSLFINDLLVAMFLSATAFGVAYAYRLRKLSAAPAIIIIILLGLTDLWRIDSRAAKYIDAPDKKEQFSEPDYVKIIKAQKDVEPFRILNLKRQGMGSLQQNSNYHAYFLLEDFYGYSAVKPRAFQDMMDTVGIGNESMWKMSNVKYLILDQPYNDPRFRPIGGSSGSYVFELNNNLKRYYFVDTVQQKPGIEVLGDLANMRFDPEHKAFTEDTAPAITGPDSTAKIDLVKYTDELTELKVNASGDNFMVYATSYQPKGWKAFVDDKEVKLYRTNHAFMGLVVPKGQHKVEMKYAPTSFYLAKNLSLGLSSFVLIGLALSLFFEFRKKKAEEQKV